MNGFIIFLVIAVAVYIFSSNDEKKSESKKI